MKNMTHVLKKKRGPVMMNQKNAIHQAKQACSHSEENMCGKENTSHRGLEKRNVLTCYKQKL